MRLRRGVSPSTLHTSPPPFHAFPHLSSTSITYTPNPTDSPSFTVFPSEMTDPLSQDRDMTVEGSLPAEKFPLTRWGRPSEMEATILYLAGPGGAYCTGTILVVDGGRLGLLGGATY